MQMIHAPGVPGYHRRRIFRFLTRQTLTETFNEQDVTADTYADALRAIKPALPAGVTVAGLIGIRPIPTQQNLFAQPETTL